MYIYIYIIPVLAIHNYILDMRTTQAYMQKYDAYEHLPRVPWTPPTSTRDVPGASLSSAAMPAKTAKTKKAFLDEKAVHWNMPKSHSAWFKGFWSEVCIQKSVYVYIYTYIYLFAYVTLHYITLHYISLHYITLHYITLHSPPRPVFETGQDFFAWLWQRIFQILPTKLVSLHTVDASEIRLTTCYLWNPTKNGAFSISPSTGSLPSTIGTVKKKSVITSYDNFVSTLTSCWEDQLQQAQKK